MEVKQYVDLNNKSQSPTDTYKERLDNLKNCVSSLQQYTEDLKKSQKDSSKNQSEQDKSNKRKQIKLMMELAGGMIARMYTKKSWRNLAEAMSKAASLCKGAEVTPAQLDRAIQLLTQGFSKLELAEKGSNEKQRGNIQESMDAHRKVLLGVLGESNESTGIAAAYSEPAAMVGSVPVSEAVAVTSTVDINV